MEPSQLIFRSPSTISTQNVIDLTRVYFFSISQANRVARRPWLQITFAATRVRLDF